MRRELAVLTGAAAALTCLISNGQVLATVPTPPTEPAGTIASEEQAAADAALLVLSDFPTGWTEEIEAKPTDQDLAYQASMAACADGTGDNLLDLGGPSARTSDFVGPDDQRVEQTVTVVDPAAAEDLMARFVAPGVDTCFRDAIVEFTTEQFGSADDPTQSTADAVTVGDVVIGEVLLPPAGDELAAYRVTLPLTVSGIDVEAFVDIVIVRSGGTVSGFTFQSVFEPFPAEDVEHYIDVVVERMTGDGAAG
jgi:hypothetical protein